MTDTTAPSSGRRYLDTVARLVSRLAEEEWANLEAASVTVADALERGGAVHAFGSGHSHILAEELFYRAGGLVEVHPILFEGLMLHASAPLSTSLERLPGLAELILDDHPVSAGDVLFVFSNSGRNPVATELADVAKRRGVTIVAITSLGHSAATSPRNGGRRLHEIADLVIDNGGVVGDAAIEITGFEKRVAPTSTALGATIVNAIVAESVGILVGRGVLPEVYASSNVDSGDAANAQYLGRVR